MNKTRYRGLLVASTGIFAGALAVSAAVQVIQPPPSDFIDTEASTNVVFAPLQVDTRQYVVKFSGDFSPSNDLEFAVGSDADGDGEIDDEPEDEKPVSSESDVAPEYSSTENARLKVNSMSGTPIAAISAGLTFVLYFAAKSMR